MRNDYYRSRPERRSPQREHPYYAFSRILEDLLGDYYHKPKADFDYVMRRLGELPLPEDTQSIEQAHRSLLPQRMDKLVWLIGRTWTERPRKDLAEQDDSPASRLEILWAQWSDFLVRLTGREHRNLILASLRQGASDATIRSIVASMGHWDVLPDRALAMLREAADGAMQASGAGSRTDDPVELPPSFFLSLANGVKNKVFEAIKERDSGGVKAAFQAASVLNVYFPRFQWGHFAMAASQSGNAALLRALWDASLPSRRFFSEPEYGRFACASATLGDRESLERVFDAWQPAMNFNRDGSHLAWASFFRAAERLGDEKLILKVFRRLEACFDPTRLRDRGTLQPYLHYLSRRLNDENIATEIAETLYGVRLDLDHCFRVLETERPATPRSTGGPFEGAARCLMRWLINQHFRCSEPEWLGKIQIVVDRVLALPINREATWHALICRGQEAYGGNIVALYEKAVRDSLGNLSDAPSHELLPNLKSCEVSERLEALLNARGELVKLDVPTVPEASPMRRLLPAIGLLKENAVDAVNGKLPPDKTQLWVDLKGVFDAANMQDFSRDDWLFFLRVLVRTMASSISTAMFEPILGRIHKIKNVFKDELEVEAGHVEASTPESERLVGQGRRLLDMIYSLLQRKRLGPPMPLTLASKVRHVVVAGRASEPLTAVNLDDSLRIHGWEGAGNELIDEILEELSFNVERSLDMLPPDQQHLRVTVVRGEGDEVAYAVLTVENCTQSDEQALPRSTSLGLGNVQRLASNLTNERGVQGYATFGPFTDEQTGLPFYRSRVYFPLWVEEQDAVPGPEPSCGA